MVDQLCSRPFSLTKKKCEIPRRKKRSNFDSDRRVTEKRQIVSLRKKRSTGNFTDEEAFLFCNNSIYTTPAVQEFPDKLAGEDPDIVVEQCVYDLTQGNDTAWVDAHKSGLNNAVDAILMLNPVYVANNTDMVVSFRLQTCLNDCSGNGACLETGLCECNGTFRGPDCSSDIRIPPVVYNIEGGEICEITEDDDCSCFRIRTNNIFDGFMCDISKNKVYFNGTRVKGNNSIHAGDYEDIFTGKCCASAERHRRSDETSDDEPFVIMYEFTVSNDGVSYGGINSVYVYDTTCLQQDDKEGNITFGLKDGYCFIDATCVIHNSKVLRTDECYLCYPATDPYTWTKGNCDERKTGLTTASLIGIATGSVLAVVMIALLVYLFCCKGSKKHRTVHDSHTNLQTTLAETSLPGPANIGFKRRRVPYTNSSPADMPVLRDISVVCAAKSMSKRNMWTRSSAESVGEANDGQVCNISTEEDGFQDGNFPGCKIIESSQSFTDMREEPTPT
ncbi:uncharacterized protein LOC123552700, partial [Mercenaria mercenaria]|uniref:uncharacterized protein LOC123552700 n=1 Tax=Mercenaria mercenaria TaxID=6596 RepID=UPI00234F8AC9